VVALRSPRQRDTSACVRTASAISSTCNGRFSPAGASGQPPQQSSTTALARCATRYAQVSRDGSESWNARRSSLAPPSRRHSHSTSTRSALGRTPTRGCSTPKVLHTRTRSDRAAASGAIGPPPSDAG
jgi:hypothetical protein